MMGPKPRYFDWILTAHVPGPSLFISSTDSKPKPEIRVVWYPIVAIIKNHQSMRFHDKEDILTS
jgi:hypothetical protein